ncbi:MAG TPA: hypothetical protein VF773_15925 [Verrucomicrobiae bacterium]
MKRGSAEIIVETNNDMVEMTQTAGTGEQQSIVLLPDQIPMLIEWLNEAHQELRGHEVKAGRN